MRVVAPSHALARCLRVAAPSVALEEPDRNFEPHERIAADLAQWMARRLSSLLLSAPPEDCSPLLRESLFERWSDLFQPCARAALFFRRLAQESASADVAVLGAAGDPAHLLLSSADPDEEIFYDHYCTRGRSLNGEGDAAPPAAGASGDESAARFDLKRLSGDVLMPLPVHSEIYRNGLEPLLHLPLFERRIDALAINCPDESKASMRRWLERRNANAGFIDPLGAGPVSAGVLALDDAIWSGAFQAVTAPSSDEVPGKASRALRGYLLAARLRNVLQALRYGWAVEQAVGGLLSGKQRQGVLLPSGASFESRLIARMARERAIPVIETHVATLAPRPGAWPSLADIALAQEPVAVEHWASLASRARADAPRMHITGSPRIDRMQRRLNRHERSPGTRPTLTLLMQPVSVHRLEYLMGLAGSAIADIPRARLRVAPHPSDTAEQVDYYQQYLSSYLPETSLVIDRPGAGAVSALRAHLVMAYSSGALIEAVALGVPAVVPVGRDITRVIDFAAEGIALPVTDPGALIDLIRAASAGEDLTARMPEAVQIRRQAWAATLKPGATDRFAAALLKALAPSSARS
ncbi:MAG: hypothetical protein MRY63_14045 [Neomegalonema sp.]|nr:hypothetical protein [Neomegalonema sp.]